MNPANQSPAGTPREVLGRAARLLASASDFRETLRHTMSACLPALGDFGFFDVANGGEVIRTVAAHEAPDIEAILAPTRWARQVRDDGMNLCALSTGEPALHTGITDEWYRRIAQNDGHLAVLRQLGFVSMITVPLRYREEVVGALTLFMGRSGRSHTREDIEFAAEIGLLAAPLVVNARLVEDHRRALDVAEKAQRRLEILSRAGAALSRSILNPEETLATIGEAVVPAIADWCRIDLLDDQGVPQRRLAHHSDPERARRALELARTMAASVETPGSMAWVMRTGQPHYGDFMEPAARADKVLSSYVDEFGMRAHCMIPLVARGRTIGAMGVLQAESGRELSADDRALVLELGQRAAMALDNARLYSAANAANRAKDEFLAMLGHELRNPLAPIATALELMSRRDADAHVEERRVIGRQVAHLSRLIDDLLDVSRITRGKVQLLREPVDMKAVVENAIEVTRPVFKRHARPPEVVLGEERAVVLGDAVRLVQVVSNLLTNAAKFTPIDASVSVRMQGVAGQVELVVQDTGAGIDAQLLPRVFDLFVQGGQAIDRRAGGLGLGLSIVRTLVEMHGGQVEAASEGAGRGSKFTVRLPASEDVLPAPRETAAPHAHAPPAMATRILVVDDNVDAAQTLAELLGVSGYEARCAHFAQQAIDEAESFRPHIALLDIGLPGVDGYALAGMLRRAPFARSGVRLFALTGYGRDNDRARALNTGFDEHLVKPVSIDQLLEVLARFPVSPPVSP